MTSTHFNNPIVLAVDDDVDDTDLLRLLLRKAGVPNPVEIYREGEEIIKALTSVAQKALKPLLCILDVKMPGMTGHEVLRWIRSQR
jgi:CheY-like chemotaxis protein